MQRRRANNPLRRIMPFSSVFSYSLFLLTLFCSVSSSSSKLSSDDAPALLAFKSTADPQNKLQFSLNKTFDHCKFQGVKCVQGRVVRLVLEGLGLDGSFGNATLTRLNQLRVLSLQNNSLTGPIPDLSGLPNLKTLFLDHNKFSGTFPLSVLSLHRLRTLDLSYNHFTGEIPSGLVKLDRVYYLRLVWNRLSGPVPAFNQSTLQVFNVSGNNLTGAVPVTVALSRFDLSSFSGNPGLCGEIVRKECRSSALPFFFDYSPVPQPPAAGENEEVRGLVLPAKSRKMAPLILGFSIAGVVIIGCLMVGLLVMKKRRRNQTRVSNPPTLASDSASAAAAAVMWVEEENELEAKVKQMQGIQIAKSGSLVFCAGEAQVYSLDQLMRASAELLGRGSIGTTYKAVLDNQLIVTVKRLDAVKTAITSRDVFERHLESVGSLRHPNLVPLRAYFQAKEEKLIIYDYQPNGSLFSLVHGSRSGRAKPLHWTSCLKIAEDVAQGLAYIHQASRLVHGNLKSSNILLGADFEACLTDYCLAVLANSSQDDSDSSAYWAPEMRKSTSQATAKSDVYSFGVLLLELLTGKPPAQHPFLMPEELLSWVRSVREVEAGEENRVAMLLELATTCSLTSSEQRPTMWRVLKMIQEIKDAVMMEDNELISTIGYS